MFWKNDKAKSLLAVAGVFFVAYFVVTGIFGERLVTAQSQDPFLSRRIDSLEQRLYGIESRISRVEQDVRSPSIISPRIGSDNDAQIRLLQSELDNLRLRVGEAECGLAKVDERTLTTASRTARVKAAPGKTDICRQDRDTAVQLSARP